MEGLDDLASAPPSDTTVDAPGRDAVPAATAAELPDAAAEEVAGVVRLNGAMVVIAYITAAAGESLAVVTVV
jgi:hypothetical protein